MNDPPTGAALPAQGASGSTVHASAAAGYARAARDYAAGRPSYPPDAAAWLCSQLRLGLGTRTLDLAAGTGKLTAALVPSGAEIVAVEPVADMRTALAASLPSVMVVAGAAEAIPVSGASVDAVTVGNAYHWFDGPRALAELARTLRPGGRLGLVWNVRDETVPWVARWTEIVDRHAGGTPRYRTMRWREAFVADAASAFSWFGEAAHRSFPNPHPTDVDGIVARALSTSFIAALPDAGRDAVATEIRDLAEGLDEPVAYPYTTTVHVWERSNAACG